VVIPAFNVAQYIGDALNSVFAQVTPVHEVLVVDDGSTDDLGAALAPFATRITFIRQANKGAPAARNAAIRRATGEWIAFLDGDDAWYPNKLQRQLELATDEVGFVFCWKHEFRDGEAVPCGTVRYDPLCCEDPLRAMLKRFFASPSTVMVRRSLLLQMGGFDETLKDGSDDADLWIRLACATRFAQVEAPLARYRLRAGSICDQQSPRQFTRQIIEPLLRNRPLYLLRAGMSASTYHGAIGRSYAAFSGQWLKKGHLGAAAWCAWRASIAFLRAVVAVVKNGMTQGVSPMRSLRGRTNMEARSER